MSDFLKNVRKVYQQGRVMSAIGARAKPFVLGSKYLLHDPAAVRVKLHAPDYVAPSSDHDEREIVRRIFQSFKKAKEDQKHVPTAFLPSSLWQGQLDRSYSHLLEGLKKNDLTPFHLFLANFGAWKQYHGVEANMLIRANTKSLIRRKYLANVRFLQQLKNWQWFYGDRKPLSCLSYPTHGNQSGAYVDGVFMGAGSFFNEIYGSLLAGLIADKKRPVVADLGAGYGKLAFFTLRNLENSSFVDFDLPETLCLAAYYLMKAWPHKKVLLYGEAEYSQDVHDEYDAIFMPSYEISKLGRGSIDLFMNKNSLGEMTAESVMNYIGHIARATRYFFHMNHDIYPNVYDRNTRGLLAHEYPVPTDTFKLLFRYPDLGHILFEGEIDYTMDIFLHLYERRS